MHKRILLSATLLLTIFLFSCAKRSANYLIVPGESVGKITAETSEEDLVKLYGTENVIPCEVMVGEGEAEPGTMIYDPYYKCSIGIVWKDYNQKNKPSEVRFLGKECPWKTAQGISLGTSLKKLESLNGGPFTLLGFDWDYQGTFMNSNQGKLSFLDRKDATGSTSESSKILVRMYPARIPENSSKSKIYQTVTGETKFSSDLPAMQELNPIIREMIIYFP